MPESPSHFRSRTLHRLRHWRRGLKQALSGNPLNDGWQPAGGQVLVIAAHPDDEVIGCGGTLRRHALAGDQICVIYLTRGQGSRGFPWLSPEQRGRMREHEARASCRLLGIGEAVFLDGREDHLEEPPPRADLVDQIAAVLRRKRPRLIYMPHQTDNHRDHVAAHALLLDALKRAGDNASDAGSGVVSDGPPSIYQYEIWSPLRADCAVDITEGMATKLRAIRLHRLALDAFNYVPTIKGLAAYRCGTLLQRNGYAEAFARWNPLPDPSRAPEKVATAYGATRDKA